MKVHNFQIVNADTDSISFCKADMTPMSKEEQDQLTIELNSLLPPQIQMADDGYFKCLLVVKSKNYVMVKDDNSVKIKGSALKATTKPKAVQQFVKDVINSLIENGTTEPIVELYHNYIRQVHTMEDITPWTKKFTITDKVMNAERTAQQKIKDAIDDDSDEDNKVSEGDKVYLYYDNEGNLSLIKNWNKESPNHDIYKCIQYLYDTLKTFESLIDLEQFTKYHLKTKRKLLTNILN